ncbi:MAG: hypothetical protein KBC62_03030 [Candidatus Pacebacteria bacterium]|nr:hypothetical protein [Candidatus Paceibacterota bacterium]MBP9842953.1 hypothetical protein [Candidatus Paceibacterota bacterium]
MKPLILLTLTLSVFFGVLASSTSLAQTPNPNQDTFYENGGPTINGGNITSGGFVPCSGAQCSLCDFAVMANTIIKWLIGIIFLFFAILAVYAGFKLVTSGGNSGAKQAAKNSFTNAFIGLFIVLAAWILIDTLLRAVLKGGNGEVNGYGPWAEIQCASQVSPTVNQLAVEDTNWQLGEIMQPSQGVPYTGGPLGQCSTSNTACSVSALIAAGFTPSQANVMSCIAMTESSGVPSTPPYNVTHPGSNSSACGLFQITRTTWNATATGACKDFASNCRKASCNAQTAVRLVQSSQYSPWTCPGCNNKAQRCITQYGG